MLNEGLYEQVIPHQLRLENPEQIVDTNKDNAEAPYPRKNILQR